MSEGVWGYPAYVDIDPGLLTAWQDGTSWLMRKILPLFFPVTYFFLLPKFSIFAEQSKGVYESIPTSSDPVPEVFPGSIRVSLPSVEDEERETGRIGKKSQVYLTTREKVDLVKPLLLRFMLPLFAVYVEEYVINSVSTNVRPSPIST